ncbi:MAG TPA: acyl-CoA thioesterase domain-containing protein [Acidimicrobiales bacterium]|nr:acyl-CoA thioesterase domain-containing protein [Acidimicrobiales bacterium]
MSERARAWWGDELVADSAAARREEPPEGPPRLWFPRADVREDRLEALAGRWEAGTGERDGHVAFDDEALRVEIAEGDVTTRFPTWGDAAHLVDLLAVRPGGEPGRYRTAARGHWYRNVVEASQMLGQAIVAAGRHAPDRRPVHAAMAFTRPADARQLLDIDLDTLSAGRTFTALAARVTQDGRLCAAGTLLLDRTSPDVVRHAAPPPDVPGPHDATPVDMGVTGREVRVVGDAYTGDPAAPAGPPVLDAWVRFRPGSVPDDPPLHAGLLAQFAGHMSIAAALRPHAGIGQDQAHRTLSTGINAITISVHGPVRADRWMLYHHLSTFAGDGMTHSECRVHGEDGALLASFTVEAMVRGFGDSPEPADDRTAL